MIKAFRCADTERLFQGERVARFANIETVARRKLEMVAAAKRLEDLRSPPGNRLEALKGDRAGQHSIRVNDQYRVCFRWNDGAEEVEIVVRADQPGDSAQTPPAFIYHTTDDELVPVEASVTFYQALRKAGVSAEMHLFARGKHGSGLGLGDAALDLWPMLLEAWLRGRGLLTLDPAIATPQK